MKLKTVLTVLFMMVMFTAIVSAQAIIAPTLEMTLLNQDPDPVTPGQYVELRFRVHNDQTNTLARNVHVRVLPSYPFSAVSGSPTEVSLGDLPGTTLRNEMITVKFKLKVDENAVEGDIPLKLEYSFNNISVTQEFDVRIQTVDANLGIVSISSSPEEILPGEMTKLSVRFRNFADSTMRDISLKLDFGYSHLLDESTAITPTESINAFNSLPFVPVGSSSEQKLSVLEPGEEYTFTYNIMTYTDAESKVYKVPVQITYHDEVGTNYTKQDIVGLVVGGEPEIYGIVDDSTLARGGRSGNVVIRFFNRGVTDARFVNVKLLETDDYEVVSAGEVYLGDVDSDDYETAEFDIYSKRSAREPRDLKFEMEYKGADNVLYTKELNVTLTPVDAGKLGQGRSPAGLIIVLILLGAGGYIYWRRQQAKKKHSRK